MSTSQQNKENVAAFYAKAAEGDAAAAFGMLLDLFAPDFVVHEAPVAPWGGDYHGREAMIGVYNNLAAFLDPTQMRVLDIVSEGDTVVVLFLAPFRASADADPVPIHVSEWYSFTDGKVTDVRVFYWETPAVEAVSAN